MVAKIAAHALDELDLLVRWQSSYGQLQNVAQFGPVHGNESVVVHVSKEAHDELTVHSVRHAAVSRNRITEVLDLEATLETGCEKATEGRNEGSKRCKNKGVQLHGGKRQRGRRVLRQKEKLRDRVWLRDENGIGIALKTSENVGAEVLVILAHGKQHTVHLHLRSRGR